MTSREREELHRCLDHLRVGLVGLRPIDITTAIDVERLKDELGQMIRAIDNMETVQTYWPKKATQ